MATKLSLKEGVNWSDPHKAAKKRAALSRAGKARGGKPMAGAPEAGVKRRGGKPMAGESKAAPAVDVNKKAPAKAKAKATPTMTRGSMKRSAIPKAEMAVQDVKQTIAPMASSGISKTKRNIQVGGLVGRTGGKWHLGKKVGKG